METKEPDPFPWPDDELSMWFGRTAYYAQRFEREFKLFLLAAEANGRITIDRKKAATTEDYLFSKQPLGVLSQILRGGGGFSDDPEFEGRIVRAIDARNEIAHNILQNYDPLHSPPEQRAAVLARLAQLRFAVGLGFLNMRELRKVAEEGIGITDEQLEQMLRNLDTPPNET
jgi:hypothetical protein